MFIKKQGTVVLFGGATCSHRGFQVCLLHSGAHGVVPVCVALGAIPVFAGPTCASVAPSRPIRK